MVAAGFEGDVGCGSDGGEAALRGLFEGDDLRVISVGVEVRALADDLRGASAGRRLGEDAAYLWVRRGESCGLGCELERSLHERLILLGTG